MKYSKEERDRICKEYINSNIKRKDLCEKYDLSFETLKSWLRRYYPGHIRIINPDSKEEVLLENSLYSDMSNKELQIELIKKDIELERLKKITQYR